jgi:type VI secretion system protein ImpA
MIDPAELLAPISPEKPCGEDLSYSPEFFELDTLVRGKPETQFSEAEEPDWKAIRESAVTLFGSTKDLRVAVYLLLAQLQLAGIAGFAAGIRLLHQLVVQYWESIHPQMDEDLDPLERINVISAVTTPEGTFGDPLQILRRLKRAPLCRSQQLGQFGLYHIQVANSPAPSEETDVRDRPTKALIESAFRDSNPEFLTEVHGAVTSAIEDVAALDQFLTQTVGSTKAASFDELRAALIDIKKQMAPYLASVGVEVAELAEGQEAGTGALGTGAVAVAGEIRSRSDVVRALDAICKYYDATEPSSPIVPLLRRCQALVGKSFLEILQEIAPDAVAQIKLERPAAD